MKSICLFPLQKIKSGNGKYKSMKTFLILLISISFSLIGLGQDYPDSGFTNRAEAKNKKVHGLKEGKWVEYYKDYTKRFETSIKKTLIFHTHQYFLTIYRAGKPYGIQRQYADGKLFGVTPYSNGEINGVEKYYNDNGTIWSERTYSNGKLNGWCREYYESGQIKWEFYCVMGKNRKGFKQYYPNGKVQSESDSSTGITKEYDEKGELTRKIIYNYTDSAHNVEKDYDSNGVLICETPYINDEINGVQKEYYENGKIKSEITYTYNLYNGIERDYYEDGVLWKEFNNVFNQNIEINGIYKKYHEDGKLAIQAIYKHGKMKQIKYYDDKTGKAFNENGNEIK